MDDALGPFGRAFVGDSPTKGTQVLLAPFVGGFLAGLWRLFHPDYPFFAMLLVEIILLGIIISIFVLSTRYIETHFNKKIGYLSKSLLLREEASNLVEIESRREISDYVELGKAGVGDIWDFTGSSLNSLFSKSIIEPGEYFKSESKGSTWIRVMLIWICTYAWLYIAAFTSLGIMIVVGFGDRGLDIFYELSSIVTYLGVGLIFLIPIIIEGKKGYTRYLFKSPGILTTILLVIFIMIVDLTTTGIVVAIWDYLIGIPEQEIVGFADPSSANDPLILMLIFINFAICPALFEELIFRGYILDSLRSSYSDIYSIVVSGLLFGLIHYSIFDPLNFFPIIATSIGGFLYAWARIKTGSLWPPIICHAIWNGSIFFYEYM